MLDVSSGSLVAVAATVGLVHTLAGPDHWLPFVAMAKAGGWTRRKTLVVTLLCGLGHVGGSLLLAASGVALGFSFEAAAEHVAGLAAARDSIATWLLIAFGAIYAAWGLKKAARHEQHVHAHAHADGTVHAHVHAHEAAAHLHPHVAVAARSPRRVLTPWILFSIFVFGPCEPLLPLVLAPQLAGQRGAWVAIVVAFTLATLLAMTAAVLFGLRATSLLARPRFVRLARFQHAIAGLLVLACGVAMRCGL
ncbi:MAG: hypothetical protein EXS13_01690 [Planctomycetes bacterium]|nr:hypothetical protein [Planctomycetota bacterium]